MNLKIINCFLAEYIRPEAPSRFTVIGLPLNIALKDPAKPCYPLISFLQLQAESHGKAELFFGIVDPQTKKEIASFKANLEVKPDDPNLKRDGFINLAVLKPLGRITFGRAGEFVVVISINKTVKKSFKILVAKAV